MAYSIDYINQICIDLGGTGGHKYDIDALNEICGLLGATAGHDYEIHALNAICTALGYTAGWRYEIEALNAICTGGGGTGGHQYDIHAWQEIQTGSLLNYESEVKTYITGLATPLSSAQKIKLNTLVKDLKTGLSIANLSDFFDTFYVLAGETQESSLKNLVKDAHHAQAVNSPAWAQYEGYTGATNKYLKTNYKAGSQGVNFTQNSAAHGAYIRSNINEPKAIAGFSDASDNGSILIPRSTSTGTSVISVNNALVYDATSNITDVRGLWIGNRLSSTTINRYRCAQSGGDLSKTSSAVKDIEDYILCFNENGTPVFFSTRQISMRFASKGMTTEQRDVINSAFETYMLAVGKSVKDCDVPAIVFSFDDGYDDNYTIAKPVFDARGKKFTQYLVTGLPAYLVGIEQFPTHKITNAHLLEMHNLGFDIQCHTQNHPSLITLTQQQVLDEYDAATADFLALGLPAPKHTAYPGGAFSVDVKTWTATKRLTGRQITTQSAFIETIDKFQIYSYNINISKGDTTALGVVKTAIDNCVEEKKFMTVYGHRVYNDADADPFTGNSIQKSYLEELLDYAIEKGMRVLTISQLYDFFQMLKVTT